MNKFRQAQKAGREDIGTEDKDFLARRQQALRDMNLTMFGMLDPISVLGGLSAGLTHPKGREALFGGKKEAAIREKDSRTEAGQLEMAHDEAWELNKKYDALKAAFEDFRKELNKQTGDPSMPQE